MFAYVNGIDLFYEQYGQGPDLLLLHGNSEDHSRHMPLIQLLAKRYRVTAADNRGHGQSSPCDSLTYHDMMADTAALVYTLGLKKPVLLGLSDGAIIGLLLDIAYPGLVGALVLCGANTSPEAFKKRWLHCIRLGWLATRDDKLALMLTQPHITPEELAQITAPTLVLAGSRDMFTPQATHSLAAAIPGSVLKTLPGETHSSYIKKPWRLQAVMEQFLRRQRQKASLA